MAWIINYTDKARKQLKKLDRHIAKEIDAYLDAVAQEPDPTVRGGGLSSNLAGYWRYRVGDYRAICEIQEETITILVVRLGHRSEIYD